MTATEILNQNKDEIIARYLDGVSTMQLGREFNCSNALIYKFLVKNKVEMRKHFVRDWSQIGEEVKKLHEEGKSLYFISDALNIPLVSLGRYAKKIGLDTSKYCKIREDFIKNHADEIIRLYQSGKSESEIGKIYDCAGSSISRLLEENKIKTRFIYTTVNHNFLDVIDHEHKAYLVGYFVGDGCNHKGNNFSISFIDLEILEKFKKILNYDSPIGTYKNTGPNSQPINILVIGSQRLSESLIRLGCPPAKTFLTKFPSFDMVPKGLMRHFIRGTICSDGSVFLDDQDIRVSIAGTKDLLGPMLDFIRKEVGVGCGIYSNRNIFDLKIGGNIQVLRFLDWLYDGATIYLERKFKIYQEFKKDYKNMKKYNKERLTKITLK